MAHQYFLHDLVSCEKGDLITLTGPEAHHAGTVSRLRIGEKCRIGNGAGLLAFCEITQVSKSEVHCVVLSVETEELTQPRLVLVQALAKTDRDERAIEAATELGVDTVVPWAANRSVSTWVGPKLDKGVAKWTSIVTEASKQSLRSFIPQVTSLHQTSQLLTDFSESTLIVLDVQGDQPISKVELPGTEVVLVVGPEGGITPEELATFRKHGAHICSMGQHVLRTSTAGPAALAIINARLGRS